MHVDNMDADTTALVGCRPTEGAVRQQLVRICSSGDFAHSERLRRFLRFIVEETLQGRGDRLKAYTVALGAFDRDDTFDPQADPIVRIEAGRLRRALEHYYLTEGTDDPVVITVPKGCYVPRFAGRLAEPPAEETLPAPRIPDAVTQPRQFQLGTSRWAAACAVVVALAGSVLALGGRDDAAMFTAPFLLVVPFASVADSTDGSVGASGLTGSLVETLASRVKVMGYETARLAQPELSLSVLRHDYGLSHVLEGDVTSRGGLMTVSARLVDADTKAVVWATRYDRVEPDAMAAVRTDIADKVAAALGESGNGAGINGPSRPPEPLPVVGNVPAKVQLAPVAALAGSPGR